MSRIAELSEIEKTIEQAEKTLSSRIHKIFHSDLVIWFKVGYSEDPSSWQKYIVIGPFDKYRIIIRPVTGGPTINVDARWNRLRLDWKDREEKQD